MAFNKAKFLAATTETETVEVPGFGTVTVRGLTGEEYGRFESACSEGEAYKSDRALLARMSVIDPETGLQVFDDSDLPILRSMPAKTLIPICKAVFRLCGVGEDAAGN